MTRIEARKLLENNPHHRLWDVNISDWTKEDIEDLKTNIKKKVVAFQPVRATLKCGKTLEFKSIVEASRHFKIHETTIGSNLRGRQKTAKGIKFERL